MTPEEAIDQIKALQNDDPESAHIEADSILCQLLQSLGFSEVVDEFDKLRKWYA